jgi:hypothetical protein
MDKRTAFLRLSLSWTSVFRELDAAREPNAQCIFPLDNAGLSFHRQIHAAEEAEKRRESEPA